MRKLRHFKTNKQCVKIVVFNLFTRKLQIQRQKQSLSVARTLQMSEKGKTQKITHKVIME